MSHSPTSYIDGVPVKISEKYKPPPKISLPQKIVQCLAQCAAQIKEDVSPGAAFNFQLERDTQIYLSSWKNQRQQDRFARKERFRQRQIERQRQHDEHQKRMLTAVSYPSAEDLSSDDEKNEEVKETVAEDGSTSYSSAESTAKVSPVQDNRPRFDSILMPTIMPGIPKPHSSWSFIMNSDGTAKPTTIPSTTQQAISAINWSDFETDTSNPFDNVELKSINDLDILAQVLKQNYIQSTVGNQEETSKNDTSPISIDALPVSANILNSNTDSPAFVNHSIGSYQHPDPTSLQVYATNFSYQNQQQPISPTIQNQHVYFNYQHPQTMHSDNNYTANCNQKYINTNYAAAYLPNSSSLGHNQTQHQPTTVINNGSLSLESSAIKANSVPDILRQLNIPSAGQALK